ncbi:peptidase S8 [Xanthomonas theicola]|uniref:Peptidase S8 n=1 Tax=Xanthomonas theicola TaxID=56464 RepID=A0A2S6ZEI2_9XANT|nr:S8 family peptidase [Xanthomonas theicola]PPT90653.1 peptidase S8 [Xanthomonas theicola]QNH26889.1 S8 family serine peptidase [Xanthomonas theicola]
MSNISQCGSRQRTLMGASALMSLLLATPAFAGEVNLSGLSSAPTVQRFIVKSRNSATVGIASTSSTLRSTLQSAATAMPAKNGRALGLTSLRRLALGPEVVKADRPLDRVEAEALMRQLAADPNVEYVEVDERMTAMLTPNDPSLSSQWAFGTTTAGINVRPAWDKATGAGVVVAVIDTGITDHPDLNANVLPGYDFISDDFISRDGDGRDADPSDEGDWTSAANECYFGSSPTDSSWHGTHVAGTVAAATNNAVGVAGTAFNAKILPVRVLGRCGGYTSDIVDAIIWASGGTVSGVPANTTPAEVINMSLGIGSACSITLQNGINGAVGRGTTVVASSGNSAANVSRMAPANCANVIAVAATTSSRAKAFYSNYGAGIDISAPGSGILSTLNDGATTPGSASYASYSGTSMAAPHVAGVAALMQSAAPSPLTPAQVETAIKNSAASFSCSQGCGAGLLDANAAVAAVLGARSGSERNHIVAVPSRSGAGSLTVSSAGGSGDADLYRAPGQRADRVTATD